MGAWAACVMTGAACSTTRSVRPLGRGAVAAGASLGGPLVTKFGAPAPLPIGTLYARVGLTERTDLDVGMLLPTVRAAGIDVGASHLLRGADRWRPAVMAGGRLGLLGNARALVGQGPLAPRLTQEVFATASWLNTGVKPFAGMGALMQVDAWRAVPEVHAGALWDITPRWQATLEGKWLAVGTRPRGGLPHWVSVAGYGALAVQVGVSYRFVGPKT